MGPIMPGRCCCCCCFFFFLSKKRHNLSGTKLGKYLESAPGYASAIVRLGIKKGTRMIMRPEELWALLGNLSNNDGEGNKNVT